VDASARPASALPQQQVFYADHLTPYLRKHRWRQLPKLMIERFAGIAFTALCSHLLIPLAIVGCAVAVALPDRRWRTLASIPLLLFGLYLLNPFSLQHYAMPMLPIAAIAVVLGVRSISQTIASERWRLVISTGLTLATVALALTSLPQMSSNLQDQGLRRLQLNRIDQALRTQVHAPAVVLFRYAPQADCLQEPVYNVDVAWPDDAPIIRAHDLNGRNWEIGAYYAEHQPRRHFYLYDRGDESLHDLGAAADVARSGADR
jgi:4-amino-4-deoxy-L-arabinose transferase-like glycosyltransferase